MECYVPKTNCEEYDNLESVCAILKRVFFDRLVHDVSPLIVTMFMKK